MLRHMIQETASLTRRQMVLILSAAEHIRTGNHMNAKDHKERFLNLLSLVPCMLELWIFLCFRFADWRNDLPAEIQIRIFWGALIIAISFLLYYSCLLRMVFLFYSKDNRMFKIGTIILYASIGFLSYIIGYFI